MKPRYRCTVTLGAAILLTSCGDGFGPQGGGRIEQLPRVLSVAEAGLVESDNRFAFKIFKQISSSEPESNIFISPLSIAMALGMTYNGSAGSTRDAMQETLELQGMDVDDVNRSYESLIDLLRNLDPRVQFTLANSIWYRDSFVFEQPFLDVTQTYFDAVVTGLDFSNPSASETINAWVREQTADRIDQIVPPVLPVDAIMYLINAIYFKGDWTVQFDPELTSDAQFTLSDGTVTTVDMMSHEETVPVRFLFSDGVQLLDLPYGGEAFRMTIVLPASETGLDAVVESVDHGKWSSWMADLDSTAMFVSLPKFTLEYEVTLNEVLTQLGMGIAFSEGLADFTNLYNGPAGRAYLSNVKHKAFVDVNEEGTEAAAATSVEVGVTSLPPQFIVNHPFVFAIREVYSGTILFMGKVLDPSR